MNCPGCQKELPGFSVATRCPFCGAELPLPVFQPVWISWPKFFAVLFAPALGSFLAGAIRSGGLILLFGLLGSLVASLICARMLMKGVNLTGFRRALFHSGLALVLCGLTWFLCFLGCTGAASLTKHGF
jgi:hypothetical protein